MREAAGLRIAVLRHTFSFPPPSHGERIAQGHEQLRARYQVRFSEPDLHARLLSRTVLGSFVIDSEIITRNFPEGVGTLEMLCVYEVVDGRIRRASFAPGEQRLRGA